ncbi:anti-sigma factor [Actinomyces sp. B33]|nr:anti-sigma factor [Actinomyces sp. B33]MDC4232693.1 anti-sigma factor [Actinomyces sp. B33]
MNEAMTCEEFESLLYALVDCEECEEVRALVDAGGVDGPSATVREAMLRHIERCPHCADALEAERRVRSLLRRCYGEPAPDGLRERIVETITRVSVRTTLRVIE